jgi:hypothetical protein
MWVRKPHAKYLVLMKGEENNKLPTELTKYRKKK